MATEATGDGVRRGTGTETEERDLHPGAGEREITDRSLEGEHHHHHLGGHHHHGGKHHEGMHNALHMEKPHLLERAPSSLPKEYETRVQIISRFPEMKSVEETYYVKEIVNEKRIIKIPKTRIVMDEHEHIDKVPVIREVERKRIEKVHRVVEEEREVTEMVKIVEMVDVPRKERRPRVVTEEIEEEVEVPTLVDVPKTRLKEVHTGNWLEAHAGEYVNPGHFNLLGKGHGLLKHKKSGSSSSSSSSDDEKKAKKGHHGLHLPGRVRTGGKKVGSRSSSSSPERRGHASANSAPTTPQKAAAKKQSFFKRLEAKLT